MSILNLNNNTVSSAFPKGKADFLLAASVTKTCEIEGITQAGIPGQIHLTPTLDAEFISTAKVFSLPNLAETPKGVPTPGLITRAVHQLSPFSQIKILDLGMTVLPQECDLSSFSISPSESIIDGSNISAKSVFEKGLLFGKNYSPKGDYIILGESTPSGTTTAQAVALALGIETDGLYSSSFKNTPNDIKNDVLHKASKHITDDLWNSLNQVADNMLLFCAGVCISASQKHQIVLAGGTQMATCALLAQALISKENLTWNPSNIILCTTSWVANDPLSNIQKLLEDSPIQSLYSQCTFSSAQIPVLHLYDEGEAKEGVGAGAAAAYAFSKGISMEAIVQEIEALMMAPLS